MSYPNDRPPALDPLAGAALTPAQRQIWESNRLQLVEIQQRAAELERKLKAAEQVPAEQSAILNRSDFNREVARMLSLDERYGGSSSVLYFNFDRLDTVATRFSQAVANAAASEIATQMLRQVRNSDIVGRLAADEFGVLLIRCSNGYAWQKAEELAALLTSRLVVVQDCRLGLDVNYGAYTFRANEDVTIGLREAAQALTRSGGDSTSPKQ